MPISGHLSKLKLWLRVKTSIQYNTSLKLIVNHLILLVCFILVFQQYTEFDIIIDSILFEICSTGFQFASSYLIITMSVIESTIQLKAITKNIYSLHHHIINGEYRYILYIAFSGKCLLANKP